MDIHQVIFSGVFIMKESYKKKYQSPNSLDQSNDISKCCETPDMFSGTEGMVCRNCGTVQGRTLVNYEARAYNSQEIQNRKRTEIKWSDIGARTVIGSKRMQSTNVKDKVLYRRLNKIQRSLVSSIERNLWEAKPKMNLLASKLILPDHIKETAWRIYIEVAKQKLTMGRSIIAFVGASIYTAIRVHELPRLLDEVADTALIPRKTVHQALGEIVRNVLPVLGLKYKGITPRQLIYRFGNDLYLPMNVQTYADKILVKATRGGLIHSGRDPRGLAASALYVSLKELGDDAYFRTQNELAQVSGITEVTLRSRIKDIKRCIKKLH